MPDCDPHKFSLVETGYVRTWRAEIDENTKTIHVSNDEFSEEGDEIVLACRSCDEKKAVPQGFTIVWP
ncbi:hypothetical protein [Gordonia alkaliphila]|uniref:hypothetical protein n=1 Tax=Gordonia alkaliphila TaxID=1053547 RepID=UPI003FD77C4B